MVHRLGYVPREQLAAVEGKLRELRQRLDASGRERKQAAEASARRLKATEEKLDQVRQRLDKTSRLLEQATTASGQLEAMLRDEAKRNEAKMSKLAADHERRVTKNADAASRQIAELEEQVRQRDAKLEDVLRDSQSMETRVTAATHDLDIAREYLMGIEVKLDILEGAANVLDTRLRTLRTPAIEPPRAAPRADVGRP